MRQLGGAIGRIPTVAAAIVKESPIAATQHALALSSSWLLILLLIGIGVYLFAKDYLDGVVESLEAIWIVFKELLRPIVADLLKRGCGARQ
jgi:hypothetical protein